MFDLDAYLDRIAAPHDPSLAELHRAHVTAIPFENLDPQAGMAVDLHPDALARKLVDERRGGYCFEHNLLFAYALRELGAEVEPMLARMRLGAPVGTVRPRTHMLLRVTIEGEVWHADVGCGSGTLFEPIPFGPTGDYDQWGWSFRVLPEGRELVLQTREGEVWRDVYAFDPVPSPLVDIELSNWYTATHPTSGFVTGLIVARQLPDGTRLSLSDWSGSLTYVRRTPLDTESVAVAREEVPARLARDFDLPGFERDSDGRLIRTL